MVRSVQFNEYIRPACLAETYSTGTMKAIATGWGKTDYKSESSDILMKVILELYPDDECRQFFLAESHSSQLRNGIDARTQFCAGSRNAKKDVCQVRAFNSQEIRKHIYIVIVCIRRETRAAHFK